MGKKSRRKNTAALIDVHYFLNDPKNLKNNKCDLQIGEIIEIESPMGIFPSGIYKVDMIEDDMICFSAGDCYFGASPEFLVVKSRHRTEPADWSKVNEHHKINNPYLHDNCPICMQMRNEAPMRSTSLQHQLRNPLKVVN
jgi:hypothetical protein